MKYMLLTYMDEKGLASLSPEERQKAIAHCWPHVEKLRAERKFVAGAGLQPTSTATTIRLKDSPRRESTSPVTRSSKPRIGTRPYRLDPKLSYGSNRLGCGIRLANARVFAESSANIYRRGMGTTIVAASVSPEGIHIAHVGDSRAYRLRAGRLERLTRDHSLLEEMKQANPDMTEEQERAFPHKNVISRAVGMREDVPVDVQDHPFLPGDCYLLCTDGLTGMVEDAAIARIAARRPLDDALAELIARANEAGGVDNITAILLERPA